MNSPQTPARAPFPAMGVETIPTLEANVADWRLPSPHFRLIAPELRDKTDLRAELVYEREWLLQPAEAEVKLQGNIFVLENILDGTGRVFLKIAAESASRAIPSEWDLRVDQGQAITLQREDGYEWVSFSYEGGRWGRIAAIHAWQRSRRPYHPGRDGLFLSNTWGDRSGDGALTQEFMQREVDAAVRLGVDVVQIDDGWQSGVTVNSTQANQGGVWNGFWAANPNFWEVNRTRFPAGLEPLIEAAHARGIQFGLWFAPDSSDDAANWQRDAEVILKYHRELGVRFFKVDAVKVTSVLSEQRLREMYSAVLRESKGAVTMDQDVTGGRDRRFGYLGLLETGPLFVENRYTDTHRYWPHHTLRVGWKLAHWIDPMRLRMEWLNHARNLHLYLDDPLAPSQWRPDALFATVMLFSPLGWFEVQNLPEAYFEEAAPLIAQWKLHREAMACGTLLPIGDAPDGVAWTGFVVLNAEGNGGYALLFRENNVQDSHAFEIPVSQSPAASCEILWGEGRAELEGGLLRVEVPEKLRFIWVKF